MSRTRKPARRPGDIFRDPETGALVRIGADGAQEAFDPGGYDPDFVGEPDRLDHIPRRADGTVSPFYHLDQDQLERMGQETPRTVRHDGWTLQRQKDFLERLAATASVTDAARYVGLSRQSARALYNRSAAFRAAYDEALRSAVGVLAETAFDRAVNGVQEAVWHEGRMVGFREKYNDRLLMFLLRVRDPLNYAPLRDLPGWQQHRALADDRGFAPALDRLAAAGPAGPGALPAPVPDLAPSLEPRPAEPSYVTSSTTSPAAKPDPA